MKDLTQGNPLKVIILFTLPLIAGNLFQQFYHLTDTLIVGQTLGVKALAAVGATGSLTFLMIGFAQGFTAGMTIITAQRYGAKDLAGVRQSMATAIISTAVMTLAITLLSMLILKPLLILMQTPAEILDDAFTFISIILTGLFAIMAYDVSANALRAVGESRAPVVHLVIALILNVILELFAILVLGWGIAGAAISTVAAQFVAAALNFIFIYRNAPILQVRRSDWHTTLEDVRIHINSGLPMGFQLSIIAIGAVMLQSALNGLGTDAVAAVTAAQRIDQIVALPLMSFGIAMATYTAQNYGAGAYDRIRIGVRQTLTLVITLAIVLGGLEITFGQSLVQIFVGSGEPQVVALAQQYFWTHGLFYWLLAILFVLRYGLQGLGDAKTPTLAGIAELVMRGGAAFLLVAPFGFIGASLADMLSWLGAVAVLLPAYLRRMKKLEQSVAQGRIRP